jgi:lysophospholipase L1-like esterase
MIVFLMTAAAAGIVFLGPAAGAEEAKVAQAVPNRLCSTGDSISEAFDAELPLANHWASWVNGYHGFWQELLGLSDVNSHSQRIEKKFGKKGKKNFMAAKSGADSRDFAEQARQAVDKKATYVTVLMGHNDVCQKDSIYQPDEDEFRDNMDAGFQLLAADLPRGATVYVVGMVDVYELWLLGEEKKALGIVDCEVLWALTLFDLFPCATVLSPFIDESERLASQKLIGKYNAELVALVDNYQKNDSNHYWVYTNSLFEYGALPANFVSDIDCFHPSARGQKELSKITWQVGPFGSGLK